MVRWFDVFLYEMGLHGDKKVTCCTMRCFHLPHEVLHAQIYIVGSNVGSYVVMSSLLPHYCSCCYLPRVRSCSLYIWQIAALWFSNWATLCSVFLNLFCKYSCKKKAMKRCLADTVFEWLNAYIQAEKYELLCACIKIKIYQSPAGSL